MLKPAEIRALCERKYGAYLRSLVTGDAVFPMQIRFGRPSSSAEWETLRSEITALDQSSADYRVEWEDVNTRRWGLQRLPQRVWVDDEAAYLRMLRRGPEAKAFRELVQLTRASLPELLPWLANQAEKSIDYIDSWPGLLKVCIYFLENPQPYRYARELPIQVDTKFIERHRGILRSLLDHVLPTNSRTDHNDFDLRFGLRFDEPLIHLRMLDAKLKDRLHLCFESLAVPISQLKALDWRELTVLIVENKKTYLTLPPCEATVGLFGGGAAAELLTSLTWLGRNRLLYWGDLDTHGLHILSRLRRSFPQTEALMMDAATLEKFRALSGSANECAYEETANLTQAELMLYGVLKEENLLLEQEKLPHEHVLQSIAARIHPAAHPSKQSQQAQ